MYLSKLILRLARLLMKLFSGYALTGFPKTIPEKCSDDDTESEDAASGTRPGPGVCILPSDIAWGSDNCTGYSRN